MDGRKKHGWMFWSVVALLVLLVAYPLSFGPVWWYVTKVNYTSPSWQNDRPVTTTLLTCYWAPFQLCFDSAPEPFAEAFGRYCSLWCDILGSPWAP